MTEREGQQRRILVDENLPRMLARRLTEAGYGTVHVHDVGLQGRPDEEVFTYARQEDLTILTGDVGFANVLQYPPPHAGIIVARLPTVITIERRLRLIVSGLGALTDQSLENTLATIEVGRIRIHR